MGYFTPVYHLTPSSRSWLLNASSHEWDTHTLVSHCARDGNLKLRGESFRLLTEFVCNPSREIAVDLAFYTHDRCRAEPCLLDHHSGLAYENAWAHHIADLEVRCVATCDDWTCQVLVGGKLQAMVLGRGATELYYFGPLAEDTCRSILVDCITACYKGYERQINLDAIIASVYNDPWRLVHACYFCDYERGASDKQETHPIMKRIARAYHDDYPAKPSAAALYSLGGCIDDASDEMGSLHGAYVYALIRQAVAEGLLPESLAP